MCLTLCRQYIKWIFLASFLLMVLQMPLLSFPWLILFIPPVQLQYKVLRAGLFMFLFNCKG